MVKKNYVAPAANEARTKLRAGLLAGSTGFGTGGGTQVGGQAGDPTIDNSDKGNDGDFARQRSVSSLD